MNQNNAKNIVICHDGTGNQFTEPSEAQIKAACARLQRGWDFTGRKQTG